MNKSFVFYDNFVYDRGVYKKDFSFSICEINFIRMVIR